MSEEVRNVFMSHIHEDDDALPQLKGLVSKSGLVVRDGSINADKPNRATSDDYIKSGILAPRIQWASVLVTLVSPETRTSSWVDWEIEYAHKLGKRIVGVWMRGARDADLPDALDKYADAVVGWNSEKIVDAITGASNDWLTPVGAPRPGREIKRFSC